ncbi:MAG: hypothetical protein HYU87_03950 [Chloroflexi bacterium]|nr:hypothetical protein [Chloroflexota bacterium]
MTDVPHQVLSRPRVLAMAVLAALAASLVIVGTAAGQSRTVQCLSGAPMIVPIVVSTSASGTFYWSSDSCGQASGNWRSSTLGGTFTIGSSVARQLSGRWVHGAGGATFDYGASTGDPTSGSWTITSYGGSFDYGCLACGHVTGGWSSFGTVGGSFHYSCFRCDEISGYWSTSAQGGWFQASCASCGTISGSWTGSGSVATPTPVPTGSATPVPTPSPTPSPAPTACSAQVGPGIPPPASVTTGIEGLHAAWYGQSGYPTLCPGDRVTVTVAYLNTGSIGWGAGLVALLGTWDPEPGQDLPSRLGGDGTLGSPSTGWPAHNRPAVQPVPYVGPGQVAWFQLTLQAPATPGAYRLAIRPVIDGVRWLEDYGVFVYLTVRS